MIGTLMNAAIFVRFLRQRKIDKIANVCFSSLRPGAKSSAFRTRKLDMLVSVSWRLDPLNKFTSLEQIGV